jgi:hypothetical protein
MTNPITPEELDALDCYADLLRHQNPPGMVQIASDRLHALVHAARGAASTTAAAQPGVAIQCADDDMALDLAMEIE